MRTTVKAAAVAAAAAAVPVLFFSAPAEAVNASAIITGTPSTVYVSPDRSRIDVKVTYTCRNTSEVRYYLDGHIQQPESTSLAYTYGYRNDTTGLQPAKCTGKPVTQTVGYLRSSNALDDVQPLRNGTADLTVHLDARGATGVGAGWYNDKTPDFSVTRTVNLVNR